MAVDKQLTVLPRTKPNPDSASVESGGLPSASPPPPTAPPPTVLAQAPAPAPAPPPASPSPANPTSSSSACLDEAGTNKKVIIGPDGVNKQVWKALTVVMGTKNISEYQGRSKYKSFPLKQDGKIGAMTLAVIYEETLEILSNPSDPQYAQVLKAFREIFGSNDPNILIREISSKLVSIKSSPLLKYYMEVGLLLNKGSKEDKDKFAEMWGLKNWDEFVATFSTRHENIGSFELLNSANFPELNAQARAAVNNYLGREISDDEWGQFIRAIYAESSQNKAEYGFVSEVILNRAKQNNSSILDILYAKNQFQAVTGTGSSPRPSTMFSSGPNDRYHKMILEALRDHLPNAEGRFYNFTAANPAAYGPGTDIGFLRKLIARGGRQVGQTIFA